MDCLKKRCTGHWNDDGGNPSVYSSVMQPILPTWDICQPKQFFLFFVIMHVHLTFAMTDFNCTSFAITFFFRHSLEHFKFWMFINDQFSDMIYTEHTVLVYISKTLCHKPLWQLKLHLTTRQHLCHRLAGSCYKLFVHNQHLYSACNLTAICAHIAPIEYILGKETRMYDKIFWFWGVQIWMMLMIFGESPPRLE